MKTETGTLENGPQGQPLASRAGAREVTGQDPCPPPEVAALTGPQASVSPWELHGQAELQCQLGLPGGAASGQLGDAVQGQPAAEEPVQHGAAQAQALVLLRELLLLLEQVERWVRGNNR